MKRGIGIVSLLAVLATGARMAVPPNSSIKAKDISGSAGEEARAPRSGTMSCSELALRTDNSASKGELAALIGLYLHGASDQAIPQSEILPKDIEILIATVPDPLHTLLNLQFDRNIEAIQQAIQDEGYTYDSSWLPWKARAPEFSSRPDQIAEEQDNLRREVCPGLILFRKSRRLPSTGSYNDSYTHGLFVFLIGEKPTTGINQIQWNNALAWIRVHAKAKGSDRTLRVLGPTFSGSAPSVARTLVDSAKQPGNFTNILLYSGTIRGCSSYRWLKEELRNSSPIPARLADFNQNDAIQVDRYFKYLENQGHSLSEVAILSEDETAYGGLPDVPTSSGAQEHDPAISCEPVYTADNAPLHLYYPRDISALRSAYEEQSIFASSTSENSNTAHIILQPRASESTHNNTDTIATFSGLNSALAQEAQMYGIVDSLRTHGIRFVILRSTNTLDYLFLARFLHRAYPDAFIVTIGPDILFGREIDSTEFRGVEALTVYPLLPRGQDWTMASGYVNRHAHRVFASDSMEGLYLAARFLVTDPPVYSGDLSPYPHPAKKDISDYWSPFWESRSINRATPSTWLTVVGRDGYWPVAILNDSASANPHQPSSTIATVIPSNDINSGAAPGNQMLWRFSLSPAWKLCCTLAVLAVCFHFYGSLFGRRRENESMFIQFVPLRGIRQFILIGLGWACIGSIVILMFLCSVGIGRYLEGANSFWVSILHIFLWVVIAGIVLDMLLRCVGEPKSLRMSVLRAWIKRRFGGQNGGNSAFIPLLQACAWSVYPLLLLAAAYWAGLRLFNPFDPQAKGVPTAYRAVHLTNGVSPMVPLLLLLGGFYWWFWHTLCGLALLGEGRPILPRRKNVPLCFARISDEMARNIESLATPLPSIHASTGFVYLMPIVVLALPLYAQRRHGLEGFEVILHSLESGAFNVTLQVLFGIALYLLSLECIQLLGTWLSLKRLLLALDRTPLRRTFSALQGLSMYSLWSLSGTSSRARYAIYSHQIESLYHLRNVLHSFGGRDRGDDLTRASIEDACNRGKLFGEKRSENVDLAMVNDRDGREIREVISQCTEQILTDLILDEWTKETTSLDLFPGFERKGANGTLPLSDDEVLCHAEEFICLVYVGYLQNLLACMRTMVLSILGVFAGLAFSLGFYPYTPRPAIAITLLMLLLVLASVVAAVYMGLSRDATLSRITNTEPGEIGLDFWFRFASFIGVPVVGLLVAEFPAITEFVTSWIVPSMNAAK
jgi:hypothetical protein